MYGRGVPGALIEGYSGERGFQIGTTMFCGTFPARGGIRAARAFIMEIEDPVLKRCLRHRYDIEALPVVE